MVKTGFESFLTDVKTIAIAGHVNPDGDCVGACLALYNYLKVNEPEKHVTVYLQRPPEIFGFLKGIEDVHTECDGEDCVDLFVLLDISSVDRIGVARRLLKNAGKTLCIDHHVTNTGGYTWFYNEPLASSTSEVLFRFLNPEKITYDCAEALYTGIVHDTGVFQYSCTSPDTMRIAASLMEKGVPFTKIIDETFFQKTHSQQIILGKVVADSKLYFGGKVIVGTINRDERKRYGARAEDMNAIVSTLRSTTGVEVAAFIYEVESGGEFKVSLRSRQYVDVSRICISFGGGGHKRAGGCTICGNLNQVVEKLLAAVSEHLK